jgi:hypothetical protein
VLLGALAIAMPAEASSRFRLKIAYWALAMTPVTSTLTLHAATGTLSYCQSTGNDGVTVSFGWRHVPKNTALKWRVIGPNRQVIRHGRVVGKGATQAQLNHGARIVGFPGGETAAPPGAYKLTVFTKHKKATGTLTVVAKSC